MTAEHDGAGVEVPAGAHGVGVRAIVGVTVDAVDLSAAVAEEFARRIGLVGGGGGPMIASCNRAILLVERGVGQLLSLRLGPYMRRTDVRVVESGQMIELPPSQGVIWHSAMRTLCAPRGREVVAALAGACSAVTETGRGLRIGGSDEVIREARTVFQDRRRAEAVAGPGCHQREESGVSGPKPMVIGYQRVREGDSLAGVENDRRVIEAFAECEGFCLGTIFKDLSGEVSALAQLVASVEAGGVAAVVVASEADLGLTGRGRSILRRLIENAGARLLVAQVVGA